MPSPDDRNVNVLFYESMIRQIDEFRFREQIMSRTEAIRVLIERGLKVKGKGKRPPGRARNA